MTTIKTIANFIQVSIIVTGSLFFSEPAKAQHQSEFVQCKSYHITENYEPGGLNSKGIYERGSIRTTRRRIPCANAGWRSAHYSHHHHAPVPYGYGHPQQQYQQQQPVQNRPPVVVNVPQNQCEGKLLRMGLGAIGGGFAGRYAVGGVKSNKTVLGTTLGAVAGSLLGRVTC